jgi:hypothetical protein
VFEAGAFLEIPNGQFDGGMLAMEGVHTGSVAAEIGQEGKVAPVRPQLRLVGVG